MNPSKFLTHIFSRQCEEKDYIILSAKRDSQWVDYPILYKGEKSLEKELGRFFQKYPPHKWDLYFSPMPYSHPRRKLEYSLDTKFLIQDIDEYAEPKKIKPPPSYLWESSPHKFQGMWELDRYIKEREYTPLNKDLAKFIGCDDCFDFCHVYRIPGTINHKYKNSPSVGLPQATNQIYKPKDLKALIGSSRAQIQPNKSSLPSKEKNPSLEERKIYAKYNIPQKIRNLLALDNLEGVDRSSTIWMIENSLYDLGMSPPEIICLIRNSLFNKYKGRPDETKRLKGELEKIISNKVDSLENNEESSSLKLTSYSQMMGNTHTFEGWLVKGFWGKRSHGIVAGMPKCFKSTLVHDLVVSVASGTPFLGKYPVLDPGPVLVVQNENADYVMKDRTEKLIYNRDLCGEISQKTRKNLKIKFPPELPIHFLNQQGFMLNEEEHRKKLEELLEEIKPVLVVFDPLYLMFNGDLNSGKDLNPTLNWLLSLKVKYNTSVILVHHYNKGGNNQPTKGGARIMGSLLLYGWIESAWYLSKEESEVQSEEVDTQSEDSTIITLSREFRMAGQYPDINIGFSMGEIGDPTYDVEVKLAGDLAPVRVGNLQENILNLLSTSNSSVTRRRMAEELGCSRKDLREALEALLEDKRIKAQGEGFIIYKPPRQ